MSPRIFPEDFTVWFTPRIEKKMPRKILSDPFRTLKQALSFASFSDSALGGLVHALVNGMENDLGQMISEWDASSDLKEIEGEIAERIHSLTFEDDVEETETHLVPTASNVEPEEVETSIEVDSKIGR